MPFDIKPKAISMNHNIDNLDFIKRKKKSFCGKVNHSLGENICKTRI